MMREPTTLAELYEMRKGLSQLQINADFEAKKAILNTYTDAQWQTIVAEMHRRIDGGDDVRAVLALFISKETTEIAQLSLALGLNHLVCMLGLHKLEAIEKHLLEKS